MITARTKRQLLVFVLITLIGVSYVGARYARLDRLFLDTSYNVDAHFVDSGGIFAGAEVTYRGVKVGQVSALNLTRDGVDVVMAIDKGQDSIPRESRAVVGNKSAVGEQYIELQPQTDSKPYLVDGSEIAEKNTEIPISTTELLTNTDNLVNSIPQDDLRTATSELGAAFKGTGRDLGQIIDTSNAFIQTANANFETTTALIRDSKVVLQTQVDKESAIRSFSKDLALFSGTLAGNDAALRKLIDNGGATATQLRTFLEDNGVELGSLVRNLVTTGQVVVKHLDGIRQVLVLYPYVVEGGFSTVGKGPDGKYDAEFGLILNSESKVCNKGYNAKERDPESERSDIPMDTRARCAEPGSASNARGSQNVRNRAPASYRAPVVATYDETSGKVTWTDEDPAASVSYTGGAFDSFGRDSWKSLLLQPVAAEE
jgi:phospholipid/cholesterol/gamma-HCH transport system substrate-binding protein